MGEYAKRKSDGERIKIGTCEDMYYLRFGDRAKVSHEPGNVDAAREPDGLRFRLPFADEDHREPGNYDEYNRYQRLYRQSKFDQSDFRDESTMEQPGTIQLHHESGLLLNVPCYHGHKLPELGPEVKAFWNGKSYSLVLSSLRIVKDDAGELKVFPVVRCRHCDEAWRYDWADVWEFVPDEMRIRLRQYVPSDVAA